MGDRDRNKPCLCGSGKKTKRCCGSGAIRPGSIVVKADSTACASNDSYIQVGESCGLIKIVRRKGTTIERAKR